ncbi:hypothetical protein C3L33_20507, partial [Rhododendron williamsianum]
MVQSFNPTETFLRHTRLPPSYYSGAQSLSTLLRPKKTFWKNSSDCSFKERKEIYSHYDRKSLKAKILATCPDAFPDDSTIEAFDQRPDLEMPH